MCRAVGDNSRIYGSKVGMDRDVFVGNRVKQP